MSDKQIVAIDSQIINNIEQCYQKWNLYNLQNWRPRNKPKVYDKGTLVHEILRKFYQEQIDGSDFNTMVKTAMEFGQLKSIESMLSLEELQEVFKTMNEYFQFYRGDRWVPLEVEKPFSYKFYEDDELIILYEGIIDLLVQNDESIFPVDHKTTSRNDAIHASNNQFIGYCRAKGTSRMYINRIGFQKSLKAADKFTRHIKSYDATVLSEWAEDVIHWVKLGILHHSLDFFPRNRTACDGKYGPCLFSDVCLSSPDSRDWKLKVDFKKDEESWDPLKRD